MTVFDIADNALSQSLIKKESVQDTGWVCAAKWLNVSSLQDSCISVYYDKLTSNSVLFIN